MSAYTKQSVIAKFIENPSDLNIERWGENEFWICGSEVNHCFRIFDDDVQMTVEGDNPMNNYTEYITHSDAVAYLY